MELRWENVVCVRLRIPQFNVLPLEFEENIRSLDLFRYLGTWANYGVVLWNK
jgi:hypothetical protein